MAPAVFGRKEVTARRGRDTGSFGHTDSERKSPLPPRKSRDAAFLHILVAISQCFGHACDFRWVTGLHLVTGWGHCLAIPPTDESIAPSGCTLHGDTEHTPHSRSHGERSHVPFTRAVWEMAQGWELGDFRKIKRAAMPVTWQYFRWAGVLANTL